MALVHTHVAPALARLRRARLRSLSLQPRHDSVSEVLSSAPMGSCLDTFALLETQLPKNTFYPTQRLVLFAKDARSISPGSLACAGIHGRLTGCRRSFRGRPSFLLRQPRGNSPTAIDVPRRRPKHLWTSTQSGHRYHIRVPRAFFSDFRHGLVVHAACLVCCQAVISTFNSFGYRRCHECSEELARHFQHLRLDQVATNAAYRTPLLVSSGPFLALKLCLTCI
jgi:hypothetical protein